MFGIVIECRCMNTKTPDFTNFRGPLRLGANPHSTVEVRGNDFSSVFASFHAVFSDRTLPENFVAEGAYLLFGGGSAFLGFQAVETNERKRVAAADPTPMMRGLKHYQTSKKQNHHNNLPQTQPR